jgi:Bacterial SCP ortholog
VGEALDALDQGDEPDRSVLRDAVRALLAELARKAPGRSVEVRIPPFGAIQCVPGPRHTRGTPPNVVEMDPMTWLLAATGRLDWASGVASGRIRASGNRTDLSEYLPLY